jgi:hypothetical protein
MAAGGKCTFKTSFAMRTERRETHRGHRLSMLTTSIRLLELPVDRETKCFFILKLALSIHQFLPSLALVCFHVFKGESACPLQCQ